MYDSNLGEARAPRRKLAAVTVVGVIVCLLGTLAACSSKPEGATGAEQTDVGRARSTVKPNSTTRIGGLSVGPNDGLLADSAPIYEIADEPAIANLDDELRRAVEEATQDARDDDVTIMINSGWRTKHYQQALLNHGIEQYGSREKARRWVNTPEKSTHVTGQAVDVGPTDAMSWMMQHGDRYGLCQTYDNEMWHFELATEPGGECPKKLRDGAEER
jgi:zinc D-Ala-D-Ala carboxypeptidase